MQKFKVGVMGCAAIAERMVIPSIIACEELELVAVASRDIIKARRYAEKFSCDPIEGYQNLLELKELDIIYMPLPTALHEEWAIKAIRAGKHVLIEKSLAANLTEAQNIANAAKEMNVLVMENFMFEHHEQFRIIREIINSGKLGALRCIRASFGFPPFNDLSNIRYNKSLAGGALLDAGAYTIKVASLLAENGLKVQKSSMVFSEEKEVDIYGGIFFTSSDGLTIQTAYGFDNYYQCELELWGSKGKLIAPRIFTAGPGVQVNLTIETDGQSEIIQVKSDNHFVNLLNFFAAKIKLNENYSELLEKLIFQAELIEQTKENAIKHYLR